MRTRDFLAILGIAAATAAVTVTMLHAARVGAADEAQPIKPRIVRPTLTSQGCTFTLKADKAEFAPDEAPAMAIEAANPTQEPVETSVWVSITGASPASMLSRVMELPATLWSHELAVRLEPGEKKTVRIEADIKLPAKQIISLMLTDKKQTVTVDQIAAPAQMQQASPAQDKQP